MEIQIWMRLQEINALAAQPMHYVLQIIPFFHSFIVYMIDYSTEWYRASVRQSKSDIFYQSKHYVHLFTGLKCQFRYSPCLFRLFWRRQWRRWWQTPQRTCSPYKSTICVFPNQINQSEIFLFTHATLRPPSLYISLSLSIPTFSISFFLLSSTPFSSPAIIFRHFSISDNAAKSISNRFM